MVLDVTLSGMTPDGNKREPHLLPHAHSVPGDDLATAGYFHPSFFLLHEKQ
jgi:hypothetical protein